MSKRRNSNSIFEKASLGILRLRGKLKVRDVFFRELFKNNKEALLELYNALNNSDYENPEDLQIITIDSAIYICHKNDVSFMVAGVVNLYEHQSTVNPNMPVRFLIYLGQEYQKIIEKNRKSIYGKSLIGLPTPKCVVFYNGDVDIPEEQILKLSDSYENKDIEPDVELTAKVINVNYGHNKELMNQCRTLLEYSEFMEIFRENRSMYSLKEAIKKTIDYCIENNILADFLRGNRANVSGCLLSDFDEKKFVYTIKSEGREEGRRDVLLEMVTEKEISKESAARRLGITVEELEKCLSDYISNNSMRF